MRLFDNRKIIKQLSRLVESNPNLRFHQLLIYVGIIQSGCYDNFFKESDYTLRDLKDFIESHSHILTIKYREDFNEKK